MGRDGSKRSIKGWEVGQDNHYLFPIISYFRTSFSALSHFVLFHIPDFGCLGPSRPLARFLGCPVVPLSRDNEGTSVPLSGKVHCPVPLETLLSNNMIYQTSYYELHNDRFCLLLSKNYELVIPWNLYEVHEKLLNQLVFIVLLNDLNIIPYDI